MNKPETALLAVLLLGLIGQAVAWWYLWTERTRLASFITELLTGKVPDETPSYDQALEMLTARLVADATRQSSTVYLDALIASVDEALTNGSNMTQANLAFDQLCEMLGAHRPEVGNDELSDSRDAP